MIVFDLDGTLANCEHRRKHVVAWKNPDVKHGIPPDYRYGQILIMRDYYNSTGEIWEADWDKFYQECVNDTPIKPVIDIFNMLWNMGLEIEIWSGRSEIVRKETIDWLYQHVYEFTSLVKLRMRPIGDKTADEDLKEQWFNEVIAAGKKIDYVFDDRIKMLAFWQSKDIFVFNVNQTGENF
jgi:hypothetical protein